MKEDYMPEFAKRFTKETNPKDKAATARLDISVWPMTATVYGALAMTEGDLKYGAYNYRISGVKASVYIAALMRHIFKWYNGEKTDPNTDVPHLASALACIGVIIDAAECGKLVDDRPPSAPMTLLLSDFEQIVKNLQKQYPNGPERFTDSGVLASKNLGIIC